MIRLMHKTQNRLTRVSAEAIGKLTQFVGFTILKPFVNSSLWTNYFTKAFSLWQVDRFQWKVKKSMFNTPFAPVNFTMGIFFSFLL